MTPQIGSWTRRPGRGTKFHLVADTMPLTRAIGQPQFVSAVRRWGMTWYVLWHTSVGVQAVVYARPWRWN